MASQRRLRQVSDNAFKPQASDRSHFPEVHLMCVSRVASVLLFLSLMALSPLSFAQESAGEFARIIVIQPKTGHASEFTAGYKRHLLWHKENKDPWAWHGWTFVLGERIGQFMDGTFGHAASDFDHAVNPAADAADNGQNVTPHADFVSHGIYERLAAASTGTMLPDASPYMTLHTYVVAPGQEAAFENAIVEFAKRAKHPPLSWYRLRIGGPIAQYLLVRPAQSFSASGLMDDVALPPGLVQQAKSELLRYQPQMSHVP